MKKNLRKLNLSRETLRTLEHLALGLGPRPTLGCSLTCPMNTDCDYTFSCTCPGACTTA